LENIRNFSRAGSRK